MASDTFKTLFFGLVLFVLFSSIIIAVAVNFGAEYDHSADEIGGGVLNLTLFEDSAKNVEGNASTQRSTFESGEMPDIDTPTGIWATLKGLVSMITTPFKLLGNVMNNLGVPPIFTSVLLGLLSIGLILAFWSILRKGD